MLDKAIEKLKAEMDSSKNSKDKNDTNIEYIGKFLIEQLNSNVEIAEKILADKKSIKGCMSNMMKVAKERQFEGGAMMCPEEGFGMILKYFEIKGAATTNAAKPIEATPDLVSPIVQNKKPSVEFNVELDF
jgi:ribosome maturation protein Sdo1